MIEGDDRCYQLWLDEKPVMSGELGILCDDSVYPDSLIPIGVTGGEIEGIPEGLIVFKTNSDAEIEVKGMTVVARQDQYIVARLDSRSDDRSIVATGDDVVATCTFPQHYEDLYIPVCRNT